MSLRAVLAAGLLLALSPGTASAFPFIVAGAATSGLPLLAALLGVLMRNRAIAPSIALGALAMHVALPVDPVAYREHMRTDSRILESVVEEERLVSDLRISEPPPSRSVSFAEARDSGAPLVWIEHTARTGQRGVTLRELVRATRPVDPATVFLSDGAGSSARDAAAITGARWVSGGIDSIAQQHPPAQVPLLDHWPACGAAGCLRVGVLLNHQDDWGGFPRGAFDLVLRIEDFLLPGRAPDDLLRRRAHGGQDGHGDALPIHVAVLGAADLDAARRWAHAIAPHFPSAFSLLARPDAFNDGDLRAQMESYIGTYRPDLPVPELQAACARGEALTLLAPSLPAWQRVIRIPQSLQGCPIVHLPVEGLLPEEIDAYLDHDPDARRILEALAHTRVVGLYLDEPDMFAIHLLGERLERHGIAWGGTVFGYDRDAAVWPQFLQRMFESLANGLQRAFGGPGSTLPLGLTSLIATAAMVVPGLLFVFLRSRLWSTGSFIAMLFAVGLALHAMQRLPLSPRPPAQLASWLAMGAFATVLMAALLAARCRQRRALAFTKFEGLRWLRSLGLRTPQGVVITDIRARTLERACRRIGFPLIFRSNELTRENRHAATMGEHESVAVPEHGMLHRVAHAWSAMAAESARPSFLVQPLLAFERSGVVRTGLMEGGLPAVRIEASATPEGVTGNAADTVESRCLGIEACLCADDPLLQDIARLHAACPQPMLLEFGIVSGAPVWLQAQRLPDDPLLLHAPAASDGYGPAPLMQELGRGTRGRLLLLSLMNRAIPFLQWRLQPDGDIVERRRATAVLFTALSQCVPWRTWLWLSSWTLARSRLRFHMRRPGIDRRVLASVRSLLLLDSMALLRGSSPHAVEHAFVPEVEFELRAVVSPYQQFTRIAELIDTCRQDLPAAQARRYRASFVIREQFRQALCYELALLSLYVQQRLVMQRLPDAGIDALAFDDIAKKGPWVLNAAFTSLLAGEARIAGGASHGLRVPGHVTRTVHRPEDIGALARDLEAGGCVDATVAAPAAWIGLFRLSPHVALFRIAAPVHRNSHFMQRAQALGIGVSAGDAGEGPLSVSSSKENP